MTDPVMTIREVAQALKVAEKTAYAMANDREIPAFKVRGQWRVRRVDFESWLANQAGMLDRPSGPPTKPLHPPVTSSPPTEKAPAATKALQMDELTERLPQEELHLRLVQALGTASVRLHAPLESKPFEMDLAPPLPQRVRVYMYNATRPPGGRPLGEHKIQLMVPGKGRGSGRPSIMATVASFFWWVTRRRKTSSFFGTPACTQISRGQGTYRSRPRPSSKPRLANSPRKNGSSDPRRERLRLKRFSR